MSWDELDWDVLYECHIDRKVEESFLYKRLWLRGFFGFFFNAGIVSCLFVAFSREATQKDYVQHHMAKNAQDVWNLLAPPPVGQGGYLYVCGDAKNMAKDVHRVLHEIVDEVTGCGVAEAERLIKNLSDSGRYLKDVW